jgi:hypothetical protein
MMLLEIFETQLLELTERLILAEAEIQRLKNPFPNKWLSPAEIQKYSQGKFVASYVRRQIEIAIDRPADSPLRIGEHFTVDVHQHRRTILIDYPEFDRLMTLEMKSIVRA